MRNTSEVLTKDHMLLYKPKQKKVSTLMAHQMPIQFRYASK